MAIYTDGSCRGPKTTTTHTFCPLCEKPRAKIADSGACVACDRELSADGFIVSRMVDRALEDPMVDWPIGRGPTLALPH